MHVTQKMVQQLERIALAQWMVWIGMTLQRANAHVEHVNDVVIGSKARAGLITLAVER